MASIVAGMPVLVTGAETGLGRMVVRAARAGGGEVRAYLDGEVAGDEDAAALRALGCKVAVGEIDDEGLLELALEQVHTLVHCWGGPLTDPGEELDGLAGVLSAAVGAGCRRLVWASHQGADDPGDVAYLRACADAEELLADAPLESVVIRRALTYGPSDPFTTSLAGGAAGVRADARHAPLTMGDLAAALVRADAMARDAVRTDLALVLELTGPQVMSVRELAVVLRRAGVTGSRTPLPPGTSALYGRDLVPGPDAVGRDGTPPVTGARAAAAS